MPGARDVAGRRDRHRPGLGDDADRLADERRHEDDGDHGGTSMEASHGASVFLRQPPNVNWRPA
jgi:hypothetical protein